MATFQNRTGADGTRKIKAIARIWLDGKQVNRIKTFSEKDSVYYEQQAKDWAEQTEKALKAEKVKMLYQATTGATTQQECADLKLKIINVEGNSGLEF